MATAMVTRLNSQSKSRFPRKLLLMAKLPSMVSFGQQALENNVITNCPNGNCSVEETDLEQRSNIEIQVKQGIIN